MITLCGFGVSNYYNKLKLILLEKQIPFCERTTYPWESDGFLADSPLGKIPFIETDDGSLSESQVILEYLEDRYPTVPLYPADPYARAKCRELIQHLELNAEWVVRRLYKECFFGGAVSDETKADVRSRLVVGLQAIERLATFSPFVFASQFTAADCVAYVHFTMIRLATLAIYGEDMLECYIPETGAYMARMEHRPHIRTMMAERAAATAVFIDLNIPYDG